MKKDFHASQLHKMLATASTRVRSETLAGYGRFWEAYTVAGELLYTLIEQGAQEPGGEVSEGASKRISLTAGLLQSTSIVEQAIGDSGTLFNNSTAISGEGRINRKKGNYSLER